MTDQTPMSTGDRFFELARSRARVTGLTQRAGTDSSHDGPTCPECDAPVRQDDGPDETVLATCTDGGCTYREWL